MNARRIAADVLQRSRNHEAFVGELLDSAFANLPQSDEFAGANRRLATQLVFGVIRRRGTLDALLMPYLTKPLDQMHPDTLDVLRLGAFQLAFLTQIPRHAAVNETIELLPTNRGQVRNFANAILRRVSELVTDDYCDSPAGDTIPLDGNFRILSRPILPDPRMAPIPYLAAAFSWPLWLADRWLPRFGFDECVRLGFWFNTPPSMWLRVNSLKSTREVFLAQLGEQGVPAEPAENTQGVQLLENASVRDLPGFDAGHFSVQDFTAMTVAPTLEIQPGMSVLDLCSAPGGKTTHLAELMGNSGRIVACDTVPKRLDTVTALCQRLGISIVETALVKDGTDAPEGPFDAALVDVPCSNTGVLARRPEVRWRLQPHEFQHLIRLQTSLLNAAIDRVKAGGIIVYSTCSIEPDENEEVVREVLRQRNGLELLAEKTSIPGSPADGGYWARLRKNRVD